MSYFKKIILILFLVAILSVSNFFYTKNASASFLSNVSFGGRIKTIYPCLKPPGLIITVGHPKGGTFFLSLQSQIYSYGAIVPGVWVVGYAAGSPVVCKGLDKNAKGFKLQFSNSSDEDDKEKFGSGIIKISSVLKGFKLEKIGKQGLGAGIRMLNAMGFSFDKFSDDDLKELNSSGAILKIGTSLF